MKPEPTFTPGDWRADTIANLEVGADHSGRDYTCYILSSTGVAVCRAQGKTEQEAIANARLISACPDLLLAVRELLGMDELEMGDESVLEQDSPNHPVILAKRAIARATKGEP